MKLYPELNGIACMNENCKDYRKVFGAFDVLQELKSCKAEEARLFGKSLLLKELEELRRKKVPAVVAEKEARRAAQKEDLPDWLRQDKGLLNYWESLKKYVHGQGVKGYEFKVNETLKALGVKRTTQHGYIKTLRAHGYVVQTAGYSNKGYYYRLKSE